MCWASATYSTGRLHSARHYPQEFNINSEVFIALLINWFTNCHFEIFSTQIQNVCVFGIWHYNAFGDLMKNFGFIAVLFYLTNKSNYYFPLPFSWIFKDLSKFIFEPTCVAVFRKYLLKKEPNSRLALPQRSCISNASCESTSSPTRRPKGASPPPFLGLICSTPMTSLQNKFFKKI